MRLRESDGGATVEGVARGLGELGELHLETAGGARTIWSGEVLDWTLPAS
ncbi:MAG: hypothetical protein U0527_13870 [Candidatus Eisenbacteria bacterium]